MISHLFAEEALVWLDTSSDPFHPYTLARRMLMLGADPMLISKSTNISIDKVMRLDEINNKLIKDVTFFINSIFEDFLALDTACYFDDVDNFYGLSLVLGLSREQLRQLRKEPLMN